MKRSPRQYRPHITFGPDDMTIIGPLSNEISIAQSRGLIPADRRKWLPEDYTILADKLDDHDLGPAARYFRRLGVKLDAALKAAEDSFKKPWKFFPRFPPSKYLKCWLCGKQRRLSSHQVCKRCHESKG